MRSSFWLLNVSSDCFSRACNSLTSSCGGIWIDIINKFEIQILRLIILNECKYDFWLKCKTLNFYLIKYHFWFCFVPMVITLLYMHHTPWSHINKKNQVYFVLWNHHFHRDQCMWIYVPTDVEQSNESGDIVLQ